MGAMQPFSTPAHSDKNQQCPWNMLCTAKEVLMMMPAASVLDQIILKLKSSGFISTVIGTCVAPLGGKNVHNGHQWSMQMGLYNSEYDTTRLTQGVWLRAGNWAHRFISTVIKHNTMWLLEIELLRDISIPRQTPSFAVVQPHRWRSNGRNQVMPISGHGRLTIQGGGVRLRKSVLTIFICHIQEWSISHRWFTRRFFNKIKQYRVWHSTFLKDGN